MISIVLQLKIVERSLSNKVFPCFSCNTFIIYKFTYRFLELTEEVLIKIIIFVAKRRTMSRCTRYPYAVFS